MGSLYRYIEEIMLADVDTYNLVDIGTIHDDYLGKCYKYDIQFTIAEHLYNIGSVLVYERGGASLLFNGTISIKMLEVITKKVNELLIKKDWRPMDDYKYN